MGPSYSRFDDAPTAAVELFAQDRARILEAEEALIRRRKASRVSSCMLLAPQPELVCVPTHTPSRLHTSACVSLCTLDKCVHGLEAAAGLGAKPHGVLGCCSLL